VAILHIRGGRGSAWCLSLAIGWASVACASSLPESGDIASAASLFDQPWRWRDERGQDVILSQWRGKVLVVTMFYRSCQTRCPMTVGKLREVAGVFERERVPANFVLVTLDPQSDTPPRLRAFKESHGLSGDSWHFLTGGEAQTRELARTLGVHPAYDNGHIDHEVRILVFDEEGRPLRRFRGWAFDAHAVLDGG
jgi:protein SCO1/2